MKRRSYHTLVKDLIRLGLCPDHILSLIPRANRYRWMNEQPSKYFGRDEDELDKYIELQKVIQLHPGRFFAYGRFISTLNDICQRSKDFKQTLKNHKDKVISAIMSSRKSIPFGRALKFFQISKNTFYNWKNSCSMSPSKICKKLHHHQLGKDEINKMENLLSDPRFFHWGISSIHQWAKRNGVLYVSLNSWYKYNKLFGWRNLKKRFRKADYSPLRASHPDQYWHADVSLHKCLDGTRGYIYAVVDNTSRKILAWDVMECLSGSRMKKVLEEAISKRHLQNNHPKLITDGGTENFNRHITTFLKEKHLTRLQAAVDIQQSNSMVESVFNQLKHQFLLRKNIYMVNQLKKYVDFFFEDANQNKPLAVLNGLTPDEAYAGRQASEIKVDDQFIRNMRRERSLKNRSDLCFSCPVDS